MSHDPTQKSALLREFIDGSLPPDQRAEAERLLEQDPNAATLLNEQDKLETFVSRVREALAMSNFPAEANDELGDEVRKAVLNQVQSPVANDTASIGLSDPLVSTDSQMADGPSVSATFLTPAQAPDEIGRLNGYRILRELGHGGMGLVFEAEDIRLKRRVALKVMKPEIAAKQQHRERFIREAQTAAAVEHDHICPIYQVGEDNGVPFIAMPFLKGEPLDALLKRQGPLKIPEAIRIAREVAEGLAAAHDAGLVHRDIKPANIWLEASPGRKAGEYRVKILDFGLARLQTDAANLTASGAILGTPAYMAPEQARSKPVDRRADLFSLGVVLYEMTTGRRPFTGDDTMSILTSLAIDDPTPPSLINFEIPAELSDLIMKLLAKSPANRPANARTVADKLLAILMRSTRPIVEALPTDSGDRRNEFNFDDPTNVEVPLASPAEPDPRSLKRKRRRPGTLVALAIALLLVVGGSFGAYKLFFETKNGTLIVEVNDKDAELRFKNGELQILDADGKPKYMLKASERNKTLPAGKYQVKVIGADGVELDTELFEIKKGGEWRIRVTAKGPVLAKKEPSNIQSPRTAFDELRREDIPPYELAMAGGGDPNRAPSELVAVVGDSRLRHWQSVNSIIFTPDGKSLVTGSADQTARIWDAATGRQKQILQTYKPENRSIWLALSQDGKTLASMTGELIKVWDLPSLTERQQLKAGTLNGGSLSKDGSLLLLAGNNDVALIELRTGKIKRLAQGQKGQIMAHALSPDGTLVAAGDFYAALKLYNAANGKELFDLMGHKGHMRAAVFSPDGRMLASGADDGLRVWDVRTGKEQHSVAGPNGVTAVAYSNDGKHLAAGDGYGKIRLWETESFKELPALTTNGVYAIAFSPDGKTVAAGLKNGFIKMWDLATGKERFNFPGHQAYINSLAVAPSGKLVATGSSDATVRVVEVPSLARAIPIGGRRKPGPGHCLQSGLRNSLCRYRSRRKTGPSSSSLGPRCR